jgi:uncharacterized flavoprotein (TIGR03862 family)
MVPGAEHLPALVVGAGPAGLMAAERIAAAGHRVVLAETMATPARKFLMAGKTGLNLTKNEPVDALRDEYMGAAAWLRPMLEAFGPTEVMAWAEGLGQPVFTGSTGRVFPEAMKASPLLRAWLARLAAAGAELRSNWRWVGFDGESLAFQTPQGTRLVQPGVTVLALGGASWRRLGSDGAWVPWLREKGVDVAPWQPANVGFLVPWSAHMSRHFGAPIKGVALNAGGRVERGEFVISARGIEGGGLYPLAPVLRAGAPLHLDLAPGLSTAQLTDRLSRSRPGESLTNRLRKLGLSPAAIALVHEAGRPPDGPAGLAARLKHLPLALGDPRPIDEAISVAGGITAASLTPDLELAALRGLFAAGEMLDWEAPTGGYLLTGCLATGRWAGEAAARRLGQGGAASPLRP